MALYSIGETEELTGVKANIIRYWESICPSISPMKDSGGRRSYSQRNIELILRMKYLVYTKKYTVEGARDQLYRETSAYEKHADELISIHELRSQLIDLYLTVRHSKAELSKGN